MTDPTTVDRRHRVVAQLGAAGAALGVVAGIVQATAGTRIPDWTGAKAAPIALGLLTIALSLLAGLAATGQRRDLIVGVRAAAALGLLVPGLVCFSTVGRLWYLPGPLLLLAGILTIDNSWRATAAHLATNWTRCLLSILGASELLMAAGATPTLMAVGAAGGAALVAAAWFPAPRRWTLLALLTVGTVPFAALAWTAIVPVLLLLTAAAVAIPLVHAGSRARSDSTAGVQPEGTAR